MEVVSHQLTYKVDQCLCQSLCFQANWVIFYSLFYRCFLSAGLVKGKAASIPREKTYKMRGDPSCCFLKRKVFLHTKGIPWHEVISGIMVAEASPFHVRTFSWALAGIGQAKLCWKQRSEDTVLRPDCFNPVLSVCGIHDVNTDSQSSSSFEKWVTKAFSRCMFQSS